MTHGYSTAISRLFYGYFTGIFKGKYYGYYTAILRLFYGYYTAILRLLFFRPNSIWIPYGIHMDSIWNDFIGILYKKSIIMSQNSEKASKIIVLYKIVTTLLIILVFIALF